MTDEWVPEMLVYLAGPYTNPDPIENTSRAITIANYLEEMFGVAVIVPHVSLLQHLVSPKPVEHWYAYDLQVLARCDVLVRIPGASTGADAEVAFAGQRGIPVFHTDAKGFDQDFRKHLRTWGYKG